jgi:hypothetical protein
MKIAPFIYATWDDKNKNTFRLVAWRDESVVKDDDTLLYGVEVKTQDFLGAECWVRLTDPGKILQAFGYLFYALRPVIADNKAEKPIRNLL